MTPHVVEIDEIPRDLYETFKTMRGIVESLPDIEGELISCHSLCKALTHFFPVTYHEGDCGISNHGWLRSEKHPAVLMDMYPVAGASSLIVFTDSMVLPWEGVYREKDIHYDQNACERQVLLLTEQIALLIPPTENTSP